MHKNRHEIITINIGVINVGIRWLSRRCSQRLTDILALRLMDLYHSWPSIQLPSGYSNNRVQRPKSCGFAASAILPSAGNISALSSPSAAP